MSEFLIFQKVSSGQFDYPTGFPDVVKDLVDKLLVIDPEKRLGAQDYVELKSHPFFRGIDFATLHSQTPPPIKPYPVNLVFPGDQDVKRKKMQDEENEKW